eukprot:Rmarinus@m.22637
MCFVVALVTLLRCLPYLSCFTVAEFLVFLYTFSFGVVGTTTVAVLPPRISESTFSFTGEVQRNLVFLFLCFPFLSLYRILPTYVSFSCVSFFCSLSCCSAAHLLCALKVFFSFIFRSARTYAHFELSFWARRFSRAVSVVLPREQLYYFALYSIFSGDDE